MNMIMRIAGVLLVVLALGRWGYDCRRYGETIYYTKTAKITVSKEVDALFGTTVEKTSTEQGYWLGLLDSAFPFGALPVAGVGIGVFVVGVLRNRKAKL
jgi:hypothetical protein